MKTVSLKAAVARVTPSLDDALGRVRVHDSDDVNADLEATGEDYAPYPSDHWLVSDDRTGGIHAQFTTEGDAHAWRMFLVGELTRTGGTAS